MTTNTCKTCRFWAEFDKDVMGDCRRYPPTILSISEDNDTLTGSPMVHADNWCGEWQNVTS